MARIRTIKPEFWTDSKTGSLSGDATKLLIGMLTFSDDYGVLEYDLAALKAKIFPYTVGTPVRVIGKSLSELLAKGLVIIFKWDERSYYWIRNFEKHQKVDKPGKPLIDGFTSAKLLETLKNQKTDLGFEEHSSNPRESSPCSVVVRECSVVEGSVKESKGEERKGSGKGEDVSPLRASDLTDEDFILKLKENDAYKHIDIDMELKKMDAWLIPRPHRKKTRTFIVKWLNRIERPLNTGPPEKPVINIRQRVKELKEEHAKKGV